MQTRPEPTSFLEVFALDRALARLLRGGLEHTPLTPVEYGVYSVVASHEEPTVTTISSRLSVPLTTASDWVQTAIARGHLDRERSAHDGRRYRLAFTRSGRAAYADAATAFQTAYLGYLTHAAQPEDVLIETLAAMRAAIDAASDELETASS